MKTLGIAARAFCLAALWTGTAPDSMAQDYPARPVTLTAPSAPGSLTVIGQFVVEDMAARLKQPFIVVAKPGAEGLIGIRTVKSAPADGYNLLLAIASMFNAHLLRPDAGYQRSDFVPVGVLASSPYFLATPTTIPSRTIRELVDYSKANPGKMFFGSLGTFSSQALLSARMSQLMGISWSEVPYKGGLEGLQAVMNNSVQGYFISNNLALTVLKNPRVNLVASTGEKRSPTVPGVPTFAELGYPQLTEETIWVVWARKETPAPVLAKLRAEFATSLKTPAVIEKLKGASMEQYDKSIDQFIKDADESAASYVALVKKLGLTPQ